MKMKKILAALAAVFMLTGCTPQEVSDTDFLLNTVSTITVYNMNGKKAQEIIDECFSLCRDYENMLSKTIKTSDVSRINSSGGKAVEVNSETAELINLAVNYSRLSNGKFDITVNSAAELWDFTGENPHIPTDSEIDEALEKINYKNINVEGNTVFLNGNGTSIDLGGIAKGYIGDRARDFPMENGVEKAIINLGGNILVITPEGDKKGATIGIQEPFAQQGKLLGTVNIKNGTVVTSGIYERYFEENGKIYHHILDTSTARPVENDLYSVTIIAENSADADALSTACFALGIDEGMKLIESLDNTEAVFVTKDLECIASSGAQSKCGFKRSE